MKRKHLKKRILTNIFVIFTCSMIISTITGYFYFAGVVKKQKISDERVKLQQLSSQIEFMTEDIESFTKSIIVDEVIRNVLEQESYSTEFDRLKSVEAVSKRLVFYNSLRTYIASSFLEQKDGRRYSSSSISMGEDYSKRKFESEEIQTYINQTEQIFSEPYFGLDSGNIKPVICYRSKIWDIHNFGSEQGVFYLEIYLGYFIKQIRLSGLDYENMCLVGNQQTLLYEVGDGQKIIDYLKKIDEKNETGVYKVKEGYLISEEIPSADWKLCVLVTNQYLWERSSFVLYFFVISFLISLTLVILSTSQILENRIRPITQLSEQMEQIDYYKLNMGEMVYTQDEIQTLYECFEKMLKEIQQSIQDRMDHEKQKKEMEFDIMLSQINPHYLYNVLNTVVYLAAAEKNTKIVKIVNALIFTLQETLNIGEHSIYTTIEKELELIACYLTIQEYRYQNTFEVIISCEKELKEYLVPKTMIQPLVENAILHGILPTERKGVIEIDIKKEEDKIIIQVKDDGVGITKEQRTNFEKGYQVIYEPNARNHIGISNVRDRIRYLYANEGSMEIKQRDPIGTVVTIQLTAKKSKEI